MIKPHADSTRSAARFPNALYIGNPHPYGPPSVRRPALCLSTAKTVYGPRHASSAWVFLEKALRVSATDGWKCCQTIFPHGCFSFEAIPVVNYTMHAGCCQRFRFRPTAAMRRTVPAQYRSGFIDIRSRICYDFPSRFIAAERKRQLSIHAALPRMNRFFHARRNRADSPFCQGRRRNLPCHAITIVPAAPCGCWPSRRCCF